MLIGKRIKFEDLKHGMDVVVQIRNYEDGVFSGEVIRGRIVFENQGYHKGCLTILCPTPAIVYDTDNFWMVETKMEFIPFERLQPGMIVKVAPADGSDHYTGKVVKFGNKWWILTGPGPYVDFEARPDDSFEVIS